jgi:hypothetical protein
MLTALPVVLDAIRVLLVLRIVHLVNLEIIGPDQHLAVLVKPVTTNLVPISIATLVTLNAQLVYLLLLIAQVVEVELEEPCQNLHVVVKVAIMIMDLI